ncbi:hypothetical protein [Vibrio comitans]|uniref:Uncharacterized protein n=1 Tax=Vibrio comitans NBRC 102076 TaxID=1219078 RepID=A0A4Y3IQV1_9VIBR|nr:hypothetical protein [Vibrio comitans]GEA61198.1 hypothetical protein VCO01S_23910 [Vibrio comitans NBRC 102076]
MKKLLILSLFSASAFASTEACIELGKAQAVNDHERVIELASAVSSVDAKLCKMLAEEARLDATMDYFEHGD